MPSMTQSMLPSEALTGLSVGLSVSDSPDLARLGLAEVHLRLALGEAARAVLLAGGRLVYGGRLDPEGYTAFLQGELEKYGRRDRPLLVCLAWQEHRQLTLAELRAAEDQLGLYGSIEYLDTEGCPIARNADRGEAPVPVGDRELRVRALSALRVHLTSVCDARVLVGGRRSGFQGAMPGVIEEALLAVEEGQPIFLAGGFGGATLDAAQALGLGIDGWPQFADTGHDAWCEPLEMAARRVGWQPESNGLTLDENLRLAASHRPSDVATLVALGLGRLRSSGAIGETT